VEAVVLRQIADERIQIHTAEAAILDVPEFKGGLLGKCSAPYIEVRREESGALPALRGYDLRLPRISNGLQVWHDHSPLALELGWTAAENVRNCAQ
jgi:hypothetical protein